MTTHAITRPLNTRRQMRQCFATDLFAVILLHFAILHGFGATVTTIIPTTFVIVVVVAIAVAFVIR